jgi:hypothetical protein
MASINAKYCMHSLNSDQGSRTLQLVVTAAAAAAAVGEGESSDTLTQPGQITAIPKHYDNIFAFERAQEQQQLHYNSTEDSIPLALGLLLRTGLSLGRLDRKPVQLGCSHLHYCSQAVPRLDCCPAALRAQAMSTAEAMCACGVVRDTGYDAAG